MEITPEEEEEMIRKIADKIHQYGMDAVAVLMLETIKPMVYLGGQMVRFFFSPFLIVFGDNIARGGEKFFMIFEKRENVEKVIALLEKKAEEEKKRKESKKLEKEEQATETEEVPTKRGWRRFLPF
jgi:hypothetical protein